MFLRHGVFAIVLLLLSFCIPAILNAQETLSLHEIPIERCDLLPVVKVRIDGADMRFLLDTGATTMLNLKSFSSGRSKNILVTSWSGTAATSAREVSLPELVLADHRLQDLKLPAIDLKRQVASLGAQTPDAKSLYDQMEFGMHHCTVAFETGHAAELEQCFDPEIVLYTPQGEFRGRAQAMNYMQERYLKFALDLHYKMNLHEVKMFGDALWYSYDYSIDSPREHIAGHGMSMCRRDNGHWRILNLHNSFLDSAPHTGAQAQQQN